MPIDRKSGRQCESGWALVSVLWAVTMLSLMAAAIEQLTLTAHWTERRAWDKARADAAFQAAICEAVLGITSPDVSQRWRVDGTPRKWVFEEFKLKITIQDESGRFDLNTIDGGTLTALLHTAGELPADQSEALSNSILNWRNAERTLHLLDGATDDDYHAAGLGYLPRHGPFQSVDELRLVLGMTPALFKKVRPALTVYTHRTLVDPNLAPRESLLALDNGNETLVDATLMARNSAEQVASPLSLGSATGVIGMGVSTAGRIFSIEIETRIDRRIYRQRTTIELTGTDIQPYVTLDWSRS